MEDEEISLLDLGVTIAENWLWLVIVPLVLGAITFILIALGGSQYRASLSVPFTPDEIAKLWQLPEDGPLASPDVELAADGTTEGIVIEASEDGSASALSMVGDTRERVRDTLDQFGDVLGQAANAGAIESTASRYAERLDEVENSIALRTRLIADLEASLAASEGSEGAEYGLTALALAQLLDGRAADYDRLEALRGEMPASGAAIADAEITVTRLGRSPLLMAALVVLGSGFVMLILVFIRQGLKGMGDDPVTRAKLERIRNGFLLRRQRP
tara:strand:- start:2063 stop:2881 length:819 start_codon:yes stop_codon:yes gene_type:complete